MARSVGPIDHSNPLALPPFISSERNRLLYPEEPSFKDSLKADFVVNNFAVGAVNNIRDMQWAQASGYDTSPITASEIMEQIDGTPYEDYYYDLLKSPDRQTFYAQLKGLQRRIDARETLANTGFWSSLGSGLIAGALDIASVMPGAAAVKGLQVGRQTAQMALVTGSYTGAAAAATEVGLQAQQIERTFIESTANTVASTILGGALGGAAGFLGSRALRSEVDAVSKVLMGTDRKVVVNEDGTYQIREIPNAPEGGRSAGAAEVDFDAELAREGLVKIPKWLEPVLKYNPVNRGLLSPFQNIRKLTNDIFAHDMIIGKNLVGESSDIALSSKLDIYRHELAKVHLDVEGMYYNLIGVKPGALQSVKASLKGKSVMSRDEFNLKVSEGLRRGDQSDIPQVQQAINVYRGVIDRFKDEAISLGLLPENVSSERAASYLMRSYNRELLKIPEYREKFIDETEQYIREINDELYQVLPTVESLQDQANKNYSLLRKLKAKARLGALKKQETGSIKENISELKNLSSLLKGELKNIRKENNSAIRALKKNISQARNTGAEEKNIFQDYREQVAENNKLYDDLAKELRKLRDEIKKESASLKGKERKNKLAKERDEFLESFEDVISSIKEEINKIEGRIKELTPRRLRDSNGNIRRPTDEDYINASANRILDNIMARGDAKLINPIGMAAPLGVGRVDPLKQTAFLIPDERIEFALDNNIVRVIDRYVMSMSTQIEKEKLFAKYDFDPKKDTQSEGGRGRLNMLVKEDYERLRDDLDSQLKNAKSSGDTKKEKSITKRLIKLDKDLEKAIKWLDESFELIDGVYGMPTSDAGIAASRVARVARNWNLVRLLGGVVLASFPDAVASVMRHGMYSYFNDGIAPVAKKFLSSGRSQSKQEWFDIGVGLEVATGRRWIENVGGPEAFYNTTGVERFSEEMAKGFGNISLSNQFNDFFKDVSAHMSSSRILRATKKFSETGEISQKDMVHLARIGIDKSMYKRINDQFKKFGDEEKVIANHLDWDDLGAFNAMRSAVMMDVNGSVLKSGLGDLPLIQRTWWGASMLQFKTYLLTATSKLLVSGIQRRDVQVFQGAMMMMFAGSLTYIAQAYAANREITDNPSQFFLESLDRSGLTGILMDIFGSVDKVMGITSDGMSRFYSRGITGAVAGPTLGLADELASLGKIINSARGTEDISIKDVKNFSRLAPYQNLFYIRRPLEQITEATARELGAKE